jgi:hypothetical protein
MSRQLGKKQRTLFIEQYPRTLGKVWEVAKQWPHVFLSREEYGLLPFQFIKNEEFNLKSFK